MRIVEWQECTGGYGDRDLLFVALYLISTYEYVLESSRFIYDPVTFSCRYMKPIQA